MHVRSRISISLYHSYKAASESRVIMQNINLQSCKALRYVGQTQSMRPAIHHDLYLRAQAQHRVYTIPRTV